VVHALLERAAMMGEREHDKGDGHIGGLRAGEGPVPAIVRQARRADERIVAYVRSKPLIALGVALGVGYLIGRMFSRLSR
jgi:hypothetical protein